MGIAEEFPGQPLDHSQIPRKYRRSRYPGRGRIRYAHGDMPHAEPFCTVSYAGSYPGPYALAPHARGGHSAGAAEEGSVVDHGTADHGAHGEPGAGLGLPWSAGFPVAGRRTDLWVLVSGGIAAAAAFAAAFVASGGLASHPAVPVAPAPAVSRSCPATTAIISP